MVNVVDLKEVTVASVDAVLTCIKDGSACRTSGMF